jgi:ectoine hydroxylase-related dioxygenase (phytanoyl-CoA dioxygenase family)
MQKLTMKKLVEEQGFAILPGVLAWDELAALSEEFLKSSLRRSRAGVRHAMKLADVAALARGPKLVGIARELLGEHATPFRATLFDKSAEANWLVVWHQDTALPLQEKAHTEGWGPWSVKDGVIYAHAPAEALARVIALRVHLDDSDSGNGPLRVLPRSHCLGVLTDERIHTLAAEVPAIDCLVAKGGVLAMKPLIVHASSKSRREQSRRVLHIEYADSIRIWDGLELATA